MTISITLGFMVIGIIFFVIASSIPNTPDTYQIIINNIQELNKNRVLCKDPQCISNIDDKIQKYQSVATLVKTPDTARSLFYGIGFIFEICSGLSVRLMMN